MFPAAALLALLVFPPSGNINTQQSWREESSQQPHTPFQRKDVAAFPLVGSPSDEDDWSSLITVCRRASLSLPQNAGLGKKTKCAHQRRQMSENSNTSPQIPSIAAGVEPIHSVRQKWESNKDALDSGQVVMLIDSHFPGASRPIKTKQNRTEARRPAKITPNGRECRPVSR